MKAIIEKIARKFEDFSSDLREIADDLPDKHQAGYGEEPDEYVAPKAAPRQERANGLDDNSTITMKSGDLRKVVDAYRRLSRFARQGRIPTQEQRVESHRAVKAVKHLIRKPRKDRD